MLFSVNSDLFKNHFKRRLRLPAEFTLDVGIVHHNPWNIIGARTQVFLWDVASKTRIAPVAQCGQRYRVGWPASNGICPPTTRSRGAYLKIQQTGQIAGM